MGFYRSRKLKMGAVLSYFNRFFKKENSEKKIIKKEIREILTDDESFREYLRNYHGKKFDKNNSILAFDNVLYENEEKDNGLVFGIN